MSGSQRSRHTYGLLANVSLVELESIRVGIKRRNITSNQPPGPMERSIDDPKALVPLVHCKKDHTPRFKSIFDREGIIVNKEERLVLIDANMYDAPRSPPNTQYESKVCRNSRSRSRSGRSLGRKSRDRDSQESYRNRKVRDGSESPDRRQRSTDRSKSRDRRRRSRSSGQRSRSPHHSRSIDRHSSLGRKRSKDRSRERTIERWKSTDRERGNSRKYSRERYTTPKRTYEKYSESPRSRSKERGSHRERKRSLTPLRPGEYRKNHPDFKKKSRSRERHRYDSRRSRSLSRTIPSTSRKRSYSPKRSSSRSPKRNKTKHYDYYERRSRSPQSSGSRDKKHYGRSHDYERDRRYKSERGRSRSPRHKETMVYRDPSLDFGYYEGMPDFWMHPGMIRSPAYPMQRFYPPAFYPRIIPGGPVMYPPRHPMMPPIIRQKLPVYNNRSKPIVTQPSDKSTPTDKADVNNEEKDCAIEELKNTDKEDKNE